MVGSFFRILLGLVAAFLVAGLVEASFIVTPADLARLSGDALTTRLQGLGSLALLAASQAAAFAGLPILAAVGFAEWRSIRSIFYYLLLSLVLAGAGILTQALGEGASTTLPNPYVLGAYAATGFAAGLVYWWTSGRGAGGRNAVAAAPAAAIAPSAT